MQNASPKPILNTSLPAQFRQIRIELAREPGHPEGDTGVAYIIVAPLDEDDRIDPTLWREFREACRIGCSIQSISSASGRIIGLQIQDREYRSALRPVAEQLRCGLDHPFAVLNQPFAVASDKVDLMLAAFLPHRLEVFDRV